MPGLIDVHAHLAEQPHIEIVEGIDGTVLAIEEGGDTIEHGFHLHERPDLQRQLAARGGILVPTLAFLADVAEQRHANWSEHLVERGVYNIEQAGKTLSKALKGSSIATCGGSKSGQVNKRLPVDPAKLSAAASMIAKKQISGICLKERSNTGYDT